MRSSRRDREHLPQVVVIGGGFAGLTAARALRRAKVEITLIDRQNYHLFQPLLYQVATAGLEPGDIAHSVREVFHGQKNIRFLMDEVTYVDLENSRLDVAGGSAIEYDCLILATGASTNTFAIPGVGEHVFPLKTLGDATSLRNHVLSQFEKADQDPSLIDRGVLTFVVVGGGPTGVEVAGALVALFNPVLRKDYPTVDISRS